jgi:hypothetical protein
MLEEKINTLYRELEVAQKNVQSAIKELLIHKKEKRNLLIRQKNHHVDFHEHGKTITSKDFARVKGDIEIVDQSIEIANLELEFSKNEVKHIQNKIQNNLIKRKNNGSQT